MNIQRWKRVGMALLVLAGGSYGGLLWYAKTQFGADTGEVNRFLHYWLLGKGRLHPRPAPPPAATRDERWQQDLDYLQTELPRLHANAFHTVTEQEWQRHITALRQKVAHVSDAQVIVGILELVALIGDGHTNVMSWSFDSQLPSAPLTLTWYGQRLYVYAATGDGVPFLGSEVIGIGGVPTAQAIQLALRVSSGDSDWDKTLRAKDRILHPDVQRWLGLQAHLFTFAKADGTRHTVSLSPIRLDQQAQWQAVKRPVLYQRGDHPTFWFTRLNEHTIYLRYLKCDDAAGFRQLTAQIVPLLTKMSDKRTLILDMRGNGGGNSMVIGPLQAALVRLGFGHGGGRAAVLTDRFTYSSAFDNTLLFKQKLKAKVYGEAPGQNLSSYGEVRVFMLPNSKLEIHLSGRQYPNIHWAALGDGLLQPDVQVQNTFQEEQAGRDRVLEAALADL